jgi:hypothetical protein
MDSLPEGWRASNRACRVSAVSPLPKMPARSRQVDQEIAGLTLVQVNKALHKYLLLGDFQLIFVGDFK